MTARIGPLVTILSLTARLGLLLAMACSPACREGVAAPPGGNPGAADFFVSPRGKDVWSGKPADPARERWAICDGGVRP